MTRERQTKGRKADKGKTLIRKEIIPINDPKLLFRGWGCSGHEKALPLEGLMLYRSKTPLGEHLPHFIEE
jgi:hypothetical protein